MDDSNVVKVLALGFNELCVVCICWGQVTDVVISPFSSPFSTVCNSHAEWGEGVEMMHCSAPPVTELVFFQPFVNRHVDGCIHCSSAVSAWWPTSSEGSPRESLSSMQGSKMGVGDGEDCDKRCAFWCLSLVSWGKTQRICRAREVISALQLQMLGLCILSCESHIFTQWCAPWRTAHQITLGTRGGFNLPDHSHLIKMHCFGS